MMNSSISTLWAIENGELYQCEDLKGALVNLAATVRYDTDNDFLPAFGAPRLRTGAATEVGNVLQDTKEIC